MKLHVMFRGKYRGDCVPSYPTMLIKISKPSFSKWQKVNITCKNSESMKSYYIVLKRNAVYDKNNYPLHWGNLMFKDQTLSFSEKLRIRVAK